MLKQGQKGFTLVELLIVVAILGVLAAVTIPNVGRFLGRGETEARKTELHNVRAAITAMMTDNNITTIPNAIATAANAANDMSAFPDATSVAGSANKLKDPAGVTYLATDKNGYLLFQHDRTAADAQVSLVNYVSIQKTKYFYISDIYGTVTQYDKPGGTAYTD